MISICEEKKGVETYSGILFCTQMSPVIVLSFRSGALFIFFWFAPIGTPICSFIPVDIPLSLLPIVFINIVFSVGKPLFPFLPISSG